MTTTRVRTWSVLSSAVEVGSAPVATGKSAEVEVLVAAKAAVADTDRVHVVRRRDVLNIVLNIIEPGGLAIACPLQ